MRPLANGIGFGWSTAIQFASACRGRVFPQAQLPRIPFFSLPNASPQEICMKKQVLAFAVAALAAGAAFAQASDTIAKVKASGVITMGVRDSSGALSYTMGDGKYGGYHVEICQRVIADVEKAVG